MVDIIGHANQTFPLTDDRFRSEAIGRADVIQSLAGRARWLYELLTGQNPFPDEQPASTKNPQGNLGHDHSGAPWGRAFLHPVAWWSGQKADANLQQPDNPLTFGITARDRIATAPMTFWNRPHVGDLPQGRIAPYSRLYLFFTSYVSGADLDVDVSVIRHGNDGGVSAMTVTRTISGAAPAGYDTLPASDDGAFLPASGGRNRFSLQWKPPAGNVLEITSWALCQVKKRTH